MKAVKDFGKLIVFATCCLITTFMYTMFRENTVLDNFSHNGNNDAVRELKSEIKEFKFGICAGLPAAGRLGNILFAYGSLLGFANRFNATVILTSKHYDYLARIFNLDGFHFVDDHVCSVTSNFYSISERWPSKYDSNLHSDLMQFVNRMHDEGLSNKTQKFVHRLTARDKKLKINKDSNKSQEYPVITINSYLQSWRYFNKSDIKSAFKFQYWIEASVKIFLYQRTRELLQEDGLPIIPTTEIVNLSETLNTSSNLQNINFKGKPLIYSSENKTAEVVYVGIHVRRGDMVSSPELDRGFTTAPKEYLLNSMKFVESKFSKWRNQEYEKLSDKKNWVDKTLVFVVSSSDFQWVHQHIKSNYHILYTYQLRSQKFSLTSSTAIKLLQNFSFHKSSMGATMYDTAMDFAFLSFCHHVIMTVGSFGWWAGYLSGGSVIYYKDYPKPNSEIASGFSAVDYYLPNWIPMS